MRVKKSIHNTIAGFSYEAVRIICSLILPRLILTSFGSDYNGLTNAISQFLSMVFLLQAGLGGVIQAALYKPIAENNIDKISTVIMTARSYVRKVSFIFIGIVLAIAILYPFIVAEDFDWLFTFSLVLIMGAGSFLQFFVTAGYGALITANQKNSIYITINIISLLLSTAVSVVMINMGYGIHAVKFGSVLALASKPLLVYLYIRRNYKLMRKAKADNSLLKQRWDNFAQELAGFICSNTDLVILSIFTNVYEVSVYTVYMLVINGVCGLISPFVQGVDAAFGNMFAKKEQSNVLKGLRVFELVVFAAATLLLSVTLVTIIPFVMVYTQGVTDIEYNRQLFSVLLVAASLFRCFRMPYIAIVNAVGHFKQTRNGAIIEMVLNIIISVTLVQFIGIIGVVIATLFSMVFRTVQYALYVSKNVVKRSIFVFIKRIVLSLACVIVVAALGKFFGLGFDTLSPNFFTWFVNAAITTLIAAVIVLAVEFLLYRDDVKTLLQLFKNRARS